MAKIFISYRREDSQWPAHSLYNAIRPYVANPDEDIFIDVDNIPLGVDFVEYLDERVNQCEVLLALIGPDWLDMRNDAGERRLDDPDDFVRIEIASALANGIPVIPVLLDGAPVPRPDELPEPLKGLSRRNGVDIRRTSFEGDSLRLIKGLRLAETDTTDYAAEEWALIEESLKTEDYRAFADRHPKHVRAFDAERRLRQLGEWAAIDQSSARAIADFRKEKGETDPLFEALKGQTKREMDRASRNALKRREVPPGGGDGSTQGRSRAPWILAFGLVAVVGVFVALDLLYDSNGGEVVLQPVPGPPSLERRKETPPTAVEEPTYSAGQSFRDRLSGGGEGPEMVVIPSGSFSMGSPSSEAGRNDDEGPQRTVRIGYQFAVGKYEVTWAEWEACVADGGCNSSGPEGAGGDNGWGRGNRPVINVDWNDAQAYVRWLSGKTGEEYRLLSEAEWEYVARAGTTGRFSWGEGAPTCSRGASNGANLSSCTSARTEPVGFSAANAFGLHDMHGNIWEWTEDCHQDSYSGAPTDGSAQIANGCPDRVFRGGSWNNYPDWLRSAGRNWNSPTNRSSDIGFRVARTL